MQERVIRHKQKRVVRRFASAIGLIVLTACLIPGAAMAAMGGTTFTGTWTPTLFFLIAPVTATCTGANSGTVTYTSSTGIGSTAVATGSNPGFYFERGTVTITSGIITAWDLNWSIATVPNGEVYVGGQKHLNATAPAPTFACTSAAAGGTLAATLNYTATYQPNTPRPPGIPNTGFDSGLATASLSFSTSSMGDPAGPGQSSGIFSETFLVPVPTVPPGCNTSTNSNGNDGCKQQGNN